MKATILRKKIKGRIVEDSGVNAGRVAVLRIAPNEIHQATSTLKASNRFLSILTCDWRPWRDVTLSLLGHLVIWPSCTSAEEARYLEWTPTGSNKFMIYLGKCIKSSSRSLGLKVLPNAKCIYSRRESLLWPGPGNPGTWAEASSDYNGQFLFQFQQDGTKPGGEDAKGQAEHTHKWALHVGPYGGRLQQEDGQNQHFEVVGNLHQDEPE